MYKIYINEKPLIICNEDQKPENWNEYLAINSESVNSIQLFNKKSFKHKGWISITNNPEKSFKKFKNGLKHIKASGGLVQNELNEYLFIFRKGKWDLPKGKIDSGETAQDAALREVEEECGLQSLILDDKLIDTWHIYLEKEKPVLKQSIWYKMHTKKQVLIPQLEEDITQALWLKTNELNRIKENTYPSIIDVLNTEGL